MPRGNDDRFKDMRKFDYSIENNPKFYQRIFKKMPLQFEESMRLQLDNE